MWHKETKSRSKASSLVGQALVPSSSEVEKDLGIMVAKNWKSSEHVNYIVARAQRIFGLIKKTFASRDASVIMPLYCSLVRSLLEYATVIWNPHLVRDVQSVERVQLRVTKTVK